MLPDLTVSAARYPQVLYNCIGMQLPPLIDGVTAETEGRGTPLGDAFGFSQQCERDNLGAPLAQAQHPGLVQLAAHGTLRERHCRTPLCLPWLRLLYIPALRNARKFTHLDILRFRPSRIADGWPGTNRVLETVVGSANHADIAL